MGSEAYEEGFPGEVLNIEKNESSSSSLEVVRPQTGCTFDGDQCLPKSVFFTVQVFHAVHGGDEF